MNRDNIVARMNLPNMAYSAERRVDVYAQAVRGLTRLEPEYEKRVKYLVPVHKHRIGPLKQELFSIKKVF
jgi:hypothetical protein